MCNKKKGVGGSETKRGWDKPSLLWWASSPKRERKRERGGGRKTSLKAVTRSAEDKKTWIKDERADTMRELWHKLWGEWGLPDERLNTCTGTATDTHRQVGGSLPTLRTNSVTSLPRSHSSVLSFPSSAQSRVGLSLQRCRPIFHPLTPPTRPPTLSILGMAVEILAPSAQTASSLPRASRAGGWLQTTV